MLAWARRLADEVPVFLNLVSKAEQGYHLAGLYHPVPDAGKISDLAVNDFLFLLSVSWLTSERLCFARGRLDAIGRLAGELAISRWGEHEDLLSGGAVVREREGRRGGGGVGEDDQSMAVASRGAAHVLRGVGVWGCGPIVSALP